MRNKTCVDNFIGLLQEIVSCRCLKRIAAILELADIATLRGLSIPIIYVVCIGS